MALHPKISETWDVLALTTASKAQQGVQALQTRRGGTAYYPVKDGEGIVVGVDAMGGIAVLDPQTGEQHPVWEGITQEQLDEKAAEILNSADKAASEQIEKVDKTLEEHKVLIDANKTGVDAGKKLAQEAKEKAEENAGAIKEESDKFAEYQVKAEEARRELETSLGTAKDDILKNAQAVSGMETTVQTASKNASDAKEAADAAKSVAGDAATQAEQAVSDAQAAKQQSELTVQNATVQYAKSANNTDAPTSGWSATRPSVSSPTDVIWIRTVFINARGEVSYSNPAPLTGPQGQKGDPGENGLPGAKGADGKTSYLHIAYATSDDGSQGFSTTVSEGKTFIGQYTDFTEADSTDRKKYAWSKIQGPQGPKGDDGEDGVTRYAYFAYATSDSGENFTTTPTAQSTYIGLCVTTADKQPTNRSEYTWSLTKGNTGEQGPQGDAGAKGDKGDDGQTWYTYFAYATSDKGDNFSKTPTAASTYMGVCITTDKPQPQDKTRYTWSLTKGNTGAQGVQGPQGAQGVSIIAVTTFYCLSADTPAQPASKNPSSSWVTTEPAYDRNKTLYMATRVDYSNDAFSWTPVQQAASYKAAREAQAFSEDAAEAVRSSEAQVTAAEQAASAAETAASDAQGYAKESSEASILASASAADAAKAASSAQSAANAALANAAELLENPGFEDGETGWDISPADKAFVQESPWSRSGERRAYLNIGLGTMYVTSTKAIPVTNGQRYRLSVWYKLTDAGDATSAGLRFQWSGDGNTWHDFAGNPDIDLDTANSDWWQLSKDIVAANGTKYVRARFAANAPINCYLDDFSLKDITLAYKAQDTADKAAEVARDAATKAENWKSIAESAQAEALNAQTTADSKNTIYTMCSDPQNDAAIAGLLKPGDLWWQTSDLLETYWEGTPNNSVSVLIDHSDEIQHMWVWNGAGWKSHTMYAQDLLVNNSISAKLLDADSVTSDKIAANALYGKVMEGGEFRTTPRDGVSALTINNAGLLLTGPSGETTVSMLASTGVATFNGVNINDGDLFSPNITAGTIVGSDFTLKDKADGTGNIIGRLNSSGMYLGDDAAKPALSFAKKNNRWVLSIDGAIQSGGEISGPTITGATIQTHNGRLKLTDGGLVSYNTDGAVTFTLNADDGSILMNGAIMSNGTISSAAINGGVITGAKIQTDEADETGIKMDNSMFAAYDSDNNQSFLLDSSGVHLAGDLLMDGELKLLTYLANDNSWQAAVRLGAGVFDMYAPAKTTHGMDRRLSYVENSAFEHREFILYGDNDLGYVMQTGWDTPVLEPGRTDMGAQMALRGGVLVFRGRVGGCTASGDNVLISDINAVPGYPNGPRRIERIPVHRSFICAGFRNSTVQPCVVYLKAHPGTEEPNELVVMAGPWDWVDLSGVTIGQ